MKEILSEKLRREFESQTGSKNIGLSLSESYDYSISEDTLYLTIKEVEANMQDNGGAFDSWALSIKRWLSDIKKIILIWEKPAQTRKAEYQRFLYRVKKSTSLYDWLEVDKSCKLLLNDLNIVTGGKYVVNYPTVEASDKSKQIEDIRESMFSKEFNSRLSQTAGMDQDKIYRQLPVGVFKEKKATTNEILPGLRSTIDLWGLNESKNQLHLFELKAKYENGEKNIPIGIYSQLFFYAMIQNELMNNVFHIDNLRKIDYRGFGYLSDYGYDNIKSIRAHFLVNEKHPLIDLEMVKLINGSLKSKGMNIEFDTIIYDFDDEELAYLEKI